MDGRSPAVLLPLIDGGTVVHALTGFLEFDPNEREVTEEALIAVSLRSREDPGCVDYWWAEDVEHPCRFRFFECWESEEAFKAHQSQPYEAAFMSDHVSRIVGADAHVLTITDRSSVAGT
jgi:quinol monooxygenase YgiN